MLSKGGRLRTFLSPVLTLLLLALAVVYGLRHREDLAVLHDVEFSEVVALALAHVLFFSLTGLTFALLVESVAVRLRSREWLTLTFLGSFVNYLLPTRPGAAVKAIYLKTHRGVPLARFTSVLAAQGFLLLLTAGGLGTLLLLWLWFEDGLFSWLLWAVCLAALGGAALPLAIRLPVIERQGRLANILKNAIEGFETIRAKRLHLLGVAATIVGQYLLAAIITVMAYGALGHSVPLRAALMVGVFTSISNFFTFTPNNLGVQELVVAYLFTLTGVDFNLALVGAALLRAVHVLVTLLFTPPLTWWLLRSDRLAMRDLLPESGVQKEGA